MARVQLSISDPTQRVSLRTMLEVDGHEVVGHAPDVFVCDSAHEAATRSAEQPTLMLAGAAEITSAIEAMRNGVVDFILLPLQPGEASLKVSRAADKGGPSGIDDLPLEKMPPLETIEREHVMRVLRKCKHNQARAARVLGIGRNTLWRKLKKWNQEGS